MTMQLAVPMTATPPVVESHPVLTRLDELRARLDAPDVQLDDTLRTYDQVEVLRTVIRQQRLSLETANQAAELSLRSQRKAGALLAALALESGTRQLPFGLQQQLGITPHQSSAWQRIARIPAPEFEQRIAAIKAAERLLSVGAFLRAASQFSRAPGPRTSPTSKLLRHAVRLLRQVGTLRSLEELELAQDVVDITLTWEHALKRPAEASVRSEEPGFERAVTCVVCAHGRPESRPPWCPNCGGDYWVQ